MMIMDPAEQRPWRRVCATCGHPLDDVPVLTLVPEPDQPVAARSGALCGATMPNTKERCARKAGHALNRHDGHRSRYSMNMDALRRRSRNKAPW